MDRRYEARLRAHGLNEDDSISMDIFEHESIGVWDNVEKRFVKRVTDEWVPES